MSRFAKGDLVRIVYLNAVGRVEAVYPQEDLVRIKTDTGSVYTERASDVEDVYEYEREAGHYGLTPKGVKPPQEGK